MRNVMLKELKLCASPITYIFIIFGVMFFLPGYPVLCGAFFVTLGIYKGFEFAREANDIEFSVLLPVSKKDIVLGKYLFVSFIEMCSLAVMLISALIRMTLLSGASVYRENFMMNANLFALAGALLIFGMFNVIFLGGFFKTAYNMGKPFLIYMAAAFLAVGALEALHHVPGLKALNAFGFDDFGIQLLLFLTGIVIFLAMTFLSYKASCASFEKIDL